ncbi:MAG: DUF2007 domain-containing protein [Flavobacteriaceae bacterium]|nr:DUF2007 domain-containing protein [Flavobacteriaceae bacterium]
MNENYRVLEVFEYSTEAQLVKSKLESENIEAVLKDEKTIDSDPLISQAIGGVKLMVLREQYIKAKAIYDKIRNYEKDKNGNPIHCPNCDSTRILVAPLERRNLFFMLFPFFEKTKYICNQCDTIF